MLPPKVIGRWQCGRCSRTFTLVKDDRINDVFCLHCHEKKNLTLLSTLTVLDGNEPVHVVTITRGSGWYEKLVGETFRVLRRDKHGNFIVYEWEEGDYVFICPEDCREEFVKPSTSTS